jgi:hypothetical protein
VSHWSPCPHCGWPLLLLRTWENAVRACSRCDGWVKQLHGKFVNPEEY